jgi:hypothetical protein
MAAPLVTLEYQTAGDTWEGIPVIGPIIINGSPPGVAAARARMKLSRVPFVAGAALSFDSEPGDSVLPITIVDADTWEFFVPEVPYTQFTLPPGDYVGHFEITDVNGKRLTTHKLKMEVGTDYTP